MPEEKLYLKGDPEDPLAYLKEFVEGEASYDPDKLARAGLKLSSQTEGLEQPVFQALAWAVGATRMENRLNAKIHALEKRTRAPEARLEETEGA